MLFSGKENVFMCLAVTKFVLRKINFGVWFIQTFLQKTHQIRQKKQNAAKENESNPVEEKMRLRGEGDNERRRGRCDRSTSGAIDDRDHRSRRSSARCDRRTSGAIWALSSLSFSLFPEMIWRENEGAKSFSGQRWKYWSTGSHFSENIIFCDSQTCGFGGKWFPEIIFTQNKRTLSESKGKKKRRGCTNMGIRVCLTKCKRKKKRRKRMDEKKRQRRRNHNLKILSQYFHNKF